MSSTEEPILYVGLASHSAIKHPAKKALDALYQGWPFPRIFPEDLEQAPGLVLARNLIATRFLMHPQKPTHLLLVDDDVGGFTADDVVRMALSGEDLIGGPLPGRNINMNHLVAAIRRGVPPEKLHHHLSPTVMVFEQKDGRANTQLVRGHLASVHFVPTAFMLISRNCLARVANEITTPPQWKKLGGEPMLTCFDFATDAAGEWVGEDVAFCLRWQSIGGKVYCDTKVALTHTGEVTFLGESLESRFAAAPARHDWGADVSDPSRAPASLRSSP